MKTKRKTSTATEVQWAQVVAQRNTWMFPLLCALIVIVTVLLVLIPQMKQVFEVQALLDTKQAELEKLVVKQTFLEGLNESELDEQIALAGKVLPNKKPVDVVIDALATEFKDLGLQLKTYSVNPGGVSTPSAVVADMQPGMMSSLTVSINAEGKRESFFQLLSRLKTLAPLSSLGNVSVNLKPLTALTAMNTVDSFGTVDSLGIEGSDELNTAISAELSIYYAFPPEVIGKVTDELPPQIVGIGTTLEEIRNMSDYRSNSVEIPVELENQRGDIFNF